MRKRHPSLGGVFALFRFFRIKSLADCHKPLVIQDFSKSYNYTPTMTNVHNDTEHSGDRSNRKIAPIFFFNQLCG